MPDLWSDSRAASGRAVQPLALRMRPRTLEEFAGQHHILGPGKLLRRMIQADAITSLILHGPPGTGKTTLAELIAGSTRRHFISENAAQIGVKRIREVVEDASHRLLTSGQRSILFLDEIHRFSRTQQDALLSDVERGVITLIGATTENPLFSVNSALVSRSTLFRLEPLSDDEIIAMLKRAIADKERGYGALSLRATDEALRFWAVKSDGDARRALTALEVAVLSANQERHEGGGGAEAKQGSIPSVSAKLRHPAPPVLIDMKTAQDSIQQKAALYDGTGDAHFDSISAMIKSVRGSDPDAALYWMARMLDAGEDPRYIARRLAILASEDIGNADPRAIMVAASAWELTERVGMPECRIILSQCAIYLSLAPKSNASYVAIDEAMADVKEGRTLPVPVYLRDANSSPVGTGMRTKDAPGQKYEYSHGSPGGINDQDHLGVERIYYRPTDRGLEKQLGEKLRYLRNLRRQRPANT